MGTVFGAVVVDSILSIPIEAAREPIAKDLTNSTPLKLCLRRIR